jgi:hypothetical protein
MKKVIVFLVLIWLSNSCFSQEYELKPIERINKNKFLFTSQTNTLFLSSFTPKLNLNFETQKRFSIFYNTTCSKMILYDNNRHFYFTQNPIQPYGNFRLTLIAGAFNYILLMLGIN